MKNYLAILSHPTWDIVFFLFLMAAGFFVGVSTSKKKIVAAILAIYVSMAIFPIFPLDTLLKISKNFSQFKSGIFLVLILLSWFIILRATRGANNDGAWWRSLILSFIMSAFIFSAFFQIAPKELITSNSLGFSPLTFDIFQNSQYAKYWTILPIIGIIFL